MWTFGWSTLGPSPPVPRSKYGASPTPICWSKWRPLLSLNNARRAMERRLEESDVGVSAHEEASQRSPLFVRWARQRRGEGAASAPVLTRCPW
jgi:hypothetical protein